MLLRNLVIAVLALTTKNAFATPTELFFGTVKKADMALVESAAALGIIEYTVFGGQPSYGKFTNEVILAKTASVIFTRGETTLSVNHLSAFRLCLLTSAGDVLSCTHKRSPKNLTLVKGQDQSTVLALSEDIKQEMNDRIRKSGVSPSKIRAAFDLYDSAPYFPKRMTIKLNAKESRRLLGIKFSVVKSIQQRCMRLLAAATLQK